ncbi:MULTISPECIES: metal-dependent hydrolase [Shewanella]|jgi:inner membrane protein|uniref:Metal-dependent hydrolase n=1 Tax=Shewanella indica TaxID=768528 RepID=A0ABU4Q740_9GAMM|nr:MULTISPECIES: metal-dependent hydrolase [Shewanella]MDX6015256.1 metal-dependent hydrolase [Shewanella indica]NDO75116.1 metal-dependent hydrolase [Shewanella sp. SE1]BCV37854.1 hydrolase [Shewanella chilikensis]
MDSLSQALLGGAIQGAMLGHQQGRRSLIYGAALATLPDLDVFIRYADPVSNMTYHRGFSHSIFVLLLLAALLTWLIGKRGISYSHTRLFVTLSLVLITHSLLDSFTIYGTQLFWPLGIKPESWSAIFIIDPIYTLPLLAAVICFINKGFSSKIRRLLVISIVFSTGYLLFGLLGKNAAENRVANFFQTQGIEVSELRAVPTPYNTLVWRVIGKSPDGNYHEVITSWFDKGNPEWITQPLNLDLAQVLDGNELHQRLKWFTGDWLRYDIIDNNLVVSDLRMGIPTLYTFRFSVAECTDSGSLVASVPETWPSRMASSAETQMIFGRIFQQDPPLPLTQWQQQNLSNTNTLVCSNAVSPQIPSQTITNS